MHCIGIKTHNDSDALPQITMTDQKSRKGGCGGFVRRPPSLGRAEEPHARPAAELEEEAELKAHGLVGRQARQPRAGDDEAAVRLAQELAHPLAGRLRPREELRKDDGMPSRMKVFKVAPRESVTLGTHAMIAAVLDLAPAE